MKTSSKVLGVLVVLLVVGLGYLGLHQSATPAIDTPSEEENVGSGGNVTSQVDVYTNGVGIGPDYAFFSRSGTLGTGVNQGAWCNSGVQGLGRTAFVEFAAVSLTGTASSTFNVYVGTSTTRTFSSDFTAPWAALMNGARFATSSTATTTSSTDTRRSGYGVVQVPVGQCVVTQVQAAGAGCLSAGGSCESATSTNRGTNFDWVIRGYYKVPNR